MMRRSRRVLEGLKIAGRRVRVLFSVVFVLYFLFLVHQMGMGAGALSGDGSNLLALKESIGCGSCETFSDWKESDSHPCAWSGVTCDPISARVVSLRIVGKQGGYTGTQRRRCRERSSHATLNPNSELYSVHAEPTSCRLTRTLSPAIWNLSELRQLSIIFNRISGELSKDVAKLMFLQTLDLRSNFLTGILPPELGKLPNLRVLNLDHNAFQGHIPDQLSSCQKLRKLSLAGNVLSGSIPPSLGNLPQLQWLSLSNNRLIGSIPEELAKGKCTLSHLDLSGNLLTGPIPAELGLCFRLRWLLLNFNHLVGSIPGNLGQLSSLKALQVAGNSLSGVIPAQLATCFNLEVVVLTMQLQTFRSCLNRTEGNSFWGELPPGFGLLPRLRVLWAPGAGLSGVLPVNWGRCENLQGLNLAGNAFTGKLSLRLKNCKQLVFLDLSSSQLTGNITLQQPIKCMRVFNTSINVLVEMTTDAFNESGRSPRSESCGKIRCSVFPDYLAGGSYPFCHPGLSMNCFGSQARLQTTCDRGWSFNRLTSGVCLTMMRRSMLAGSFSQNKLTDKVGTLPTQSLYNDQQSDTKKLSSILVAAITSGCAIAGVLFILGILFQCTRQRSQGRPSSQPGRKAVITFMNINHHLTYENVVKATGNFSIDNLIGCGGFGATYKAEVKPGLLVAVKRLAIGRFQGVQQFDTEIRTLGRIRHPNLVTLIGYHASHEDMFLIYNFFSKGNLETLIHSCRDEMDWGTRHRVALRVAEALAYLHDDCVPRVLHRDIKPSNILLDDDLNAHLSDFGLARLLGASETHATTDVAGTFGYVAPEYAMTCRVTEKADVYSYGVVLLELLSSKRALDPSFCEYGDGFNIVSWACLLIRRGQASEVFTTKLWENGPEKSLLEALKLAVLCTVDQLSVRPTMKEVVNCLGKIRPEVSMT